MSSGEKKLKIGIIGGTGLDNPDLLENREEKYVETPFGKPSDALIIGQIKGVDCVILARHGRGHHLYPSNINFCANLWALKAEGCTCVIATNACGSLKEEIPPGHVVICDQLLDWTRRRRLTYYDGSEDNPCKGVCHIPMADPFCAEIRKVLIESVIQSGGRCHETGTIVVVEGPRFSTRAESKLFQSFGASVIGMTTVPEVTMAHEIGLPYANMSLVTDYDCWKEDEAITTVDGVDACMKRNAELAKNTLLTAIPLIAKINWDPICSRWQGPDFIRFRNHTTETTRYMLNVLQGFYRSQSQADCSLNVNGWTIATLFLFMSSHPNLLKLPRVRLTRVVTKSDPIW